MPLTRLELDEVTDDDLGRGNNDDLSVADNMGVGGGEVPKGIHGLGTPVLPGKPEGVISDSS